MKSWNGTMIIGCDHGYGNIKTANTVFPSCVTAYDSKPVFGGDILIYDGIFYKIGEGHKEFVADKTADKDYYILTLAAIAKELDAYGLCSARVYLAVGLPLAWVRTQRSKFKLYLLQKESVEFIYNDRKFTIHFEGCRVFPQGYPALVDKIKECKGRNLLVDIGNGTMNIMYIIDYRVNESKVWTEKYGVNQCVIATRNAVLEKLEAKIDDQTIEDVLRTGEADITTEYLECIQEEARKYVAGIFAALKRYEYNPDTTHLWVVGGGGCLIKNFGDYEEERTTIIEDICAAAKGYEQLAIMALRKAGD